MRTSVKASFLFVSVALYGCGSRGVTPAGLEKAFAPTFANLVHVQESMLGLPAVDASLLQATATCRRVGPGSHDAGGGSWKCTVEWSIPGQRGPVHDSYDLSVSMDGCYAATVDEAHLGGPTLKKRDGSSVINLLYAFDGCFDAS